jgi:poly(3-hydroxybutyrate) depolymerase
MTRIYTALIGLWFIMGCNTKQAYDKSQFDKTYELKELKDLSFAAYNSELKANLYQPVNPGFKTPLVICVHPGGFILGDRKDPIMTQFGKDFAVKGFAAASVDYSLIGLTDILNQKKVYYKAIQDVRTAIRYFKANAAEYNIDSSRVFLLGYSAGAIISLNIAYLDQSEAEKGFFNGIASSGNCLDCPYYKGQTAQNNISATVKAVFAISGAVFDPDCPLQGNHSPVMLYHGDRDSIVPYREGKPFTEIAEIGGRRSMAEVLYHIGVPPKIPGLKMVSGADSTATEVSDWREINALQDIKLDIPDWLPRLIVWLSTPDMYGSAIISNRDKTAQFKTVKDGSHNFLMDPRQQLRPSYKEVLNDAIKHFTAHL